MTRLDFDPDLERLGDALRASTAVDLAREERAARPARARRTRPRPRVLAGSTLGLAGVGAALVLALGGTAATTPAFAVTRASDGSVLVQLNYQTDQNLPQVNQKLAAMGTHEQIGIAMATGPASVTGPGDLYAGARRVEYVRADGEGSRRHERHGGHQPGRVRRQHSRGHLPSGLLRRVPG